MKAGRSLLLATAGLAVVAASASAKTPPPAQPRGLHIEVVRHIEAPPARTHRPHKRSHSIRHEPPAAAADSDALAVAPEPPPPPQDAPVDQSDH